MCLAMPTRLAAGWTWHLSSVSGQYGCFPCIFGLANTASVFERVNPALSDNGTFLLERLDKIADRLSLLFAQARDGFVVWRLRIGLALCYALGDLTRI
jgi:hypothetical protein